MGLRLDGDLLKFEDPRAGGDSLRTIVGGLPVPACRAGDEECGRDKTATSVATAERPAMAPDISCEPGKPGGGEGENRSIVQPLHDVCRHRRWRVVAARASVIFAFSRIASIPLRETRVDLPGRGEVSPLDLA
jgi:hypothetical protein